MCLLTPTYEYKKSKWPWFKSNVPRQVVTCFLIHSFISHVCLAVLLWMLFAFWMFRISGTSIRVQIKLESLMTLLWIQSSLKPSSPEVTSVTVSRTILLALSGSLERLLNARIKQISAKADLACSNWSPFVRMHSASLVISVAADVLAFWPSLKFRRAWDSDTTSETAFTVFTSSQFQKKTPIVSRFQKISNRWRLQYINIGVIVCTVNEKGPKNSLSLSGCCLCPFTRSTQ